VEIIETNLTGKPLLAEPYLNKGTAFPGDERDAFGLRDLVPLHTSTITLQPVALPSRRRAQPPR
jgi:malate dehydrogenase (oxaloacetate-decarboxylating)